MTKYISALQNSVPLLFGLVLPGIREAPGNKQKFFLNKGYLGQLILMSSSKIGEAKNWEYQ